LKYTVFSKARVGSSFYPYTKGDRAYLKMHEFIRTPFNPIEWAINQRRGLHNFSLDFLASHRYYCLSDDFAHNPLMLHELPGRKQRGGNLELNS